jgi:SWIM/SEC-C metal-binding protein
MAKLGTNKRPARGHVQTMERAQEILKLCDDRGWIVIIEIEPDMPEDISEVERLLNPPKPIQAESKIGRNEPCPCGSGKKFKKCCMNR